MPRQAALSPLMEFAPMENAAAVAARSKTLASQDPEAAQAFEKARKAMEINEQQIKPRLDAMGEDLAQPRFGLAALEGRVRSYVGVLRETMALERMQAAADAATRENSDPMWQASALAKLAEKSQSTTLPPLAEAVKEVVQQLVAARERVANGGHPMFDKELAGSAREVWLLLDEAYDHLGMALRRLGIVDDPVLLARPDVRSSLRPVTVSAAARKTKKKAKQHATRGAKGKGSAQGEKTVAKPEEKPVDKPAETPAQAPAAVPEGKKVA